MNDDVEAKGRFEEMYAGGPPPWDIGKPLRAFVEAADLIEGCLLDAGCGTGENALFFAERGHDVTGIDFRSPQQKGRPASAASTRPS